MALKFRADIEGLRAFAVLAVVLFHAGVGTLAGGFTGVDIFFVISGFLITSIISRDIDTNSFSILEFYKRRISRIFPALFAMILISIAVGMALLMPSELKDLGKSAAAAVAFSSNIYFWKTAGYFDGSAETKVLLHTWSLGVEEQFYIFWPFIILCIYRFIKTKVIYLLWAFVAVSFLVAWVVGIDRPQASFYLLPMRFWELAIGGLVALGGFPRLAPPLAGKAAVLGLVLIVAGILAVNETMSFPAPWALVPCLGAALLLAYGEHASTAWLFTLQPVRWIGSISYPLYLWHWPIIVFYRIQFGRELSLVDTVVLVALSVIAADLTLRCIERPTQRVLRAKPRAMVVTGGSMALASVAAGCLLVANRADSLHPLPPEIRQIAAMADYDRTPEHAYQFRPGKCFEASDTGPYDFVSCTALDQTRPNYVLIGDSFAAQYWRALSQQFPRLNILQATASGCLPVEHAIGAKRCRVVVEYAFHTIVPKTKGVILAGRWTAQQVPQLIKTVRDLRRSGKSVTVIGPGVEYNSAFPILLAKAIKQKSITQVELQVTPGPYRLDKEMRSAVQNAGGQYYSPIDRVCQKHCALYSPNGKPLHFDYGHVTLDGAKWVLKDLNKL